MKPNKKTIIFNSKEEFELAIRNSILSGEVDTENEKPAFNGVSKEFAEANPNYELDNLTNAYCWNCINCVNCISCDTCKYCSWCRNCDTCDSCVQCDFCKETIYSVWCNYIEDSNNCHFIKYSIFSENSTGLKNRMDKQESDYHYDLKGKRQYFASSTEKIEYTHENFKSLKKQFGFTNSIIADEIGLTPDSVKNQTAPAKELPTWAKSMIFVWKRIK